MERELKDDLTGAVPVKTSDPEAEKAIISLCIRKSDSLNDIIGKITIEDFADKRHAVMFEELSRLYLESASIDRITLSDSLKKSGKIEKAGGIGYVFEVGDIPAVASNIESYVDIVVAKSRLRQMLSIFEELKAKAESGKHDVNDIIDLGVNRLTDMRTDTSGDGFESLKAILLKNITEIRSMAAGNEVRDTYRTGFRMLDNITGGFRPGTLNIIAARPGMGKTALVINIATNVGVLRNRNVDIFSLEMSKSEIGNRILASRSDTSAKDLQRAKLSKEQEDQIMRVYDDLKTLPIYIDDRSDVSPVTMLAKCKDLKAQGKLGLVIVDYLQLMNGSGLGRSSSRQDEITYISRSLKVMAKELNVPIIALSQLNRSAEKRGEDHMPQLSDLRDSGAIEQDADCVIFIHRSDYYDKDKKEQTEEIVPATLNIAKNRHGETGKVELMWWGAKTLFFEENMASTPEDPTKNGMQSSAPQKNMYPDGTEEDEDQGVPPFDPDSGDMDSNIANDDYFSDSNTDFPDTI
ncbi:MAG: replicative DNA helicase [Clostridiales bacterium]|nr:replicative DNA helicase [Clostridiales bacterium]